MDNNVVEKIANLLSLDFERFEGKDAADRATDAYLQACEEGVDPPLLLIPDERLLAAMEAKTKTGSPQEYQAVAQAAWQEAQSSDLDSILDRWKQGTSIEDWTEPLAASFFDPKHGILAAYGANNDMRPEPIEGVIAKVEARLAFDSFSGEGAEAVEDILLFRLPSKDASAWAAWICLAVNQARSMADTAALFSYWQQNDTALPAVVSSESWELFLPSPVIDKERANDVAQQQQMFCPILRGAPDLMSELLGARNWYFYFES